MALYRALIPALVAAVAALSGARLLSAMWPTSRAPVVMVATRPQTQQIEQGRQYFAMSCAHCHADDATGDEGPNLHKLKITDAHIHLVVTNGIKGEMPTFAKKYDDAQISSIAAFLRSLE